MKYATARPYADPEKAARRILEIANAVEPIQGRIHIEKINEPFLFRDGGSPAEYGAGLKLAIERGWLKMHESRDFRHLHAGRRGIVRLAASAQHNRSIRKPCRRRRAMQPLRIPGFGFFSGGNDVELRSPHCGGSSVPAGGPC